MIAKTRINPRSLRKRGNSGSCRSVPCELPIEIQPGLDPSPNKLTGFTQSLTTQRTNAQGNPVTSTVTSQVTYTLDANGPKLITA